MIQDIFPYQLKNAFCDSVPVLDDCLFSFRDGKVLLKVKPDGRKGLPSFKDLTLEMETVSNLALFLFTAPVVNGF